MKNKNIKQKKRIFVAIGNDTLYNGMEIKMKRILLSFFCVLLIGKVSAFAETEDSGSACLMNAVTGEVLYEKNAYEERPMASTTKIMTAVAALENSDLYDIVTMTDSAVRAGGSSTYAKPGDQLYMEDALFGLMLNSGNDAAEAIALCVSGSIEEFAGIMNRKAVEIGAVKTCFLNPSGLPQDGHSTTAYDLALIARYAMKNDKFAEIVSTKKRTVWPVNNPEHPLTFINHNKLLDLYDGCIGIKTGFTKKAGRCLVSCAERDGMKYIAVTLNDGNDWNNHKEMYEKAFSVSYPIKAVEKGECVMCSGKYSFIAEIDFIVPSQKDKKTEIEVETCVPQKISGPVNKGEKIGYLRIMYKENEIGRVNVISENDIYQTGRLKLKKSLKSNIIRCMKNITV